MVYFEFLQLYSDKNKQKKLYNNITVIIKNTLNIPKMALFFFKSGRKIDR